MAFIGQSAVGSGGFPGYRTACIGIVSACSPATGTSLSVVLSADGADGIVVADAARAIQVGPVTRTIYDAAGNVTSQIDGRGNATIVSMTIAIARYSRRSRP